MIKSTSRRDEVRNSRTDQEQTRPRYRPYSSRKPAVDLWWTTGVDGPMEMGTGNV